MTCCCLGRLPFCFSGFTVAPQQAALKLIFPWRCLVLLRPLPKAPFGQEALSAASPVKPKQAAGVPRLLPCLGKQGRAAAALSSCSVSPQIFPSV